MKRIFLVICVILFAAIILAPKFAHNTSSVKSNSWTYPENIPSVEGEYETYADSTYNFQIKYPKGAQISISEDDSGRGLGHYVVYDTDHGKMIINANGYCYGLNIFAPVFSVTNNNIKFDYQPWNDATAYGHWGISSYYQTIKDGVCYTLIAELPEYVDQARKRNTRSAMDRMIAHINNPQNSLQATDSKDWTPVIENPKYESDKKVMDFLLRSFKFN